MKSTVSILIAVISIIWQGNAAAGDAAAGKSKAEGCLECHFADDFKGQAGEDIAELIKGNASESSEHPEDISSLSAADIADIAAFFASGE